VRVRRKAAPAPVLLQEERTLCHRCNSIERWVPVRGGTRLRCVGCLMVFPCRGTCQHLDCADARRGLVNGARALKPEEQRAVDSRARELRGAIRTNVEALDRGEVDHDTFSAKQRELWDAVRAAGALVEDRVLAMIRADLPSRARAS
jgi:hypothetical protein